MIPVTPQPEPSDFDIKVRQPGQKWIHEKGIDINNPLLKGIKLKSFWVKCLPDLFLVYNRICAYSSLYIPRTTGGKSVDHFAAKSSRPDQAYEWSNYRLSCLNINARKNVYEDVLDPFTLKPETFHMNFFNGQIEVNPDLSPTEQIDAKATIERLSLDHKDCRDDRLDCFNLYLLFREESYLKDNAPFVWYEAKRQKLL